MVIAIETVLTIGFAFILLLFLSVKFKKFGRYMQEQGIISLGIIFSILGALSLAISYLSVKFEIEMFSKYAGTYMRIGSILLVLGAVLIIFDRIYRNWKKELKLRLEKERREFIERVRYGLKIDEAERIAKQHIKQNTGKDTVLVASKKEFKRWAIYLKDREKNYYRVIVDQEGRIEEWETMKELPRYFLGV